MKTDVTDVLVEDCRSIVLVRPMTETAREWVGTNVNAESWQWFGDALAVEPRYIEGLLEGLLAEGLTIGAA